MKVETINPRMLVLEYRQEKDDEEYGSCLWARFYFNLDNGELLIMSDCGNYGYRWGSQGNESFLKLMARVGSGYLKEKLCGRPKVFDYKATKEHFYEYADVPEDRAKLDEIFEEIESEYEPESGETFLRMFDELNVNDHNHAIFCDTWEYLVYVYTPQQNRICEIFRDYLQPKIKEILKEGAKESNDA